MCFDSQCTFHLHAFVVDVIRVKLLVQAYVVLLVLSY